MPNHEMLSPDAHKNLRIRQERGSEFGDAVMSCITVPDEFRQVQSVYPILFRLSPERDSFTALAMFGFETGENLFLEGDRWDADYVPLAVDIQPFLIGSPDGQGEKQVHIDMDSPRIAQGEGTRLFDQAGRTTPFLDAMTEKLGALDAGYQASAEFFAALQRHDLLEPMSLEVTLDDGATNRLVGFHVIAEEKLQSLDAAAVAELHQSGHLMPIFMAVASLGHLNALIARKNKRVADG